ncbi:hypothetical protein FE810_13125 [Thalassotalea litorea]|uniref:Uncharacterized protein n=1 Tax=Thalassotalea litorea TaxID=2020715 RepID=A0A5R9IF55_9GAMM|nr:hypothetical protein [Thalassotalea litorea]TLU61993.1 hypothetical protein FE810_13125 [Thalassotalea litorea]
MNLFKWIAYLSFCLIPTCKVYAVEADVCSENKLYDGKLFQLDVFKFGMGHYKFEFCVDSQQGYLISQYTKHGRSSESSVHKSTVTLTNQLTQDIKKQYLKSLSMNLKDDLKGHDGSTWCFMPKEAFSHSNHCVWFPEYNSEERGLNELIRLGGLAFEHSNLKLVGATFSE